MTNIVDAELQRFEAVAHQWWDRDGPFRPLHDLNPERLRFVSERVTLRGAEVLDVGCGGGLLSEAMAAEGAKVLGIDAGAQAIEVARLHALEVGSTVNYQQVEVEALQPAEPRYDVVTCMELLEHVDEPQRLLQACHTRLRSGGSLFVSTLHRTLKSYLLAVVGAEYLAGLLPKGTHDYQRFIRPSELALWLRQTGFELSSLAGLEYNPFTRTARLSRDVSVNYIVRAVKR